MVPLPTIRIEVDADNVKLLLAKITAHDPKIPIILCQVMPTSGEKQHRPVDQIRKLNQLLADVARGNEQVTLLDTYTLFANAQGEAKLEEFPDLLHPNKIGYAKWAAALRPVLATLPTAVQLVGRVHGDTGLMACAAFLEQALMETA